MAKASAARRVSRSDRRQSATVTQINPDQSYLKTIKPKSPNQKILIDAIQENNLILAIAPAGTGKTFLAVCAACDALTSGKVGRIVLTRPAVEAGESLGYLPGDMQEKMAPYLRPLYDVLVERLSQKRVTAFIEDGLIEIAPVGYLRGRTLTNAFVVVDEAQNCTYTQIKMILTRIGWNTTMVVTGDPDQSDLPHGQSGLKEIADKLEAVPAIPVIRLSSHDIVRHPLVSAILDVI